MEKCKRKSVDPIYSMCVQPSFIIGTNNEDGSYNFAPITWVSATMGEDDGYYLVVSMFGTKRTKLNVIRTGVFSANLVSRDMLFLMDYLGSKHAKDGKRMMFLMMLVVEQYLTCQHLTRADGYMSVKLYEV